MAVVLTLVGSLAGSARSADTRMSDFRWKNRLLVASGASEEWVASLEEEKAELAERDLKMFVLSGVGTSEYPAHPKIAKEFAGRLGSDPENPTIHLIGKDGRATLEWSLEAFRFDTLHARIDAMPMRRREMRGDR